MDKFEDAFKKISKVNLATHIELWGKPKTEKLYFEAGQQSRQAEVDEANAKSQMCRDEKTHAINRWSQIRKEVEEKDKRIEELERSCISYKNQRDDYAQKLMVKSVHYSSIQEELVKLKDRLELAHHLATQSTWSSLKQLKKVVKALRGENANS